MPGASSFNCNRLINSSLYVVPTGISCLPISTTFPCTALILSSATMQDRCMRKNLLTGNSVQHLLGSADNPQSLLYLTDQKVFNTWPPFLFVLLIFNLFFFLVTLAIWKGKFTPGKRRIKLV